MNYNIFLITLVQLLIFIILGIYFFSLNLKDKIFTYNLFWITLFYRLIIVFFYYNFFIDFHGEPFLLLESDEMGYNGQGIMLSNALKNGNFNLLSIFPGQFSDFGYPLFLSIVYTIFGQHVLWARIIQAFLSAFSTILLYKIAKHYFSLSIAKLASIFMMLCPIFSLFSAIHLKETVFIFLILLSMHYATKILYYPNRFIIIKYILFTFITFSLFAFRPAVAISMIMSFLITYLYSGVPGKKIIRPIILIFYSIVFLFLIYTFSLNDEINSMIEKSTSYSNTVVSASGSRTLINIAGLPVFLIIGLIGPLPNLLNFNIDQEQLLTINLFSGDAILKGFLAFFVLNGLLYLIKNNFKQRLYLLLVFFLNFIIVILAGVSFNYRFQLIFLPIFFIFTAVGIMKTFNDAKFKYFIFYSIVYTFITIIFNYVKLKDLGMLLM
jgi:4-amino-4-deoxy-L-arabinose transferase-like glycosyltransferase